MADLSALAALGALAGLIFPFVWWAFWDVDGRLRKEIRSDLLAAQGRIWGDEFAPRVAQLLIDLTRETGPITEGRTAKEIADNLRKDIRSDLLAAQGRIWGDEFAPRVAQLLIDLTGETGPITEGRTVKEIADNLTAAGYFGKLREANDAGLAAERLEQEYDRLKSDGGRAFWSLAFVSLALPGSWLFSLLPGFENKEGWWMALVAGWGVALAVVFLFGVSHVVRYRQGKGRLEATLDRVGV